MLLKPPPPPRAPPPARCGDYYSEHAPAPASDWPCVVVLLLALALATGAIAFAWWLGGQERAPSPSCAD